MYIYVYTYTCACVCVCVCVCVYIYIYTHIYIFTHTHACGCRRNTARSLRSVAALPGLLQRGAIPLRRGIAGCSATQSVATQRPTCCIPAQPRLAAATQPTPSAAAVAIGATDGCDRPQSALESSERMRWRTECLVNRVLRPAAL